MALSLFTFSICKDETTVAFLKVYFYFFFFTAVEWYWVEGTPLGAGYENFIGPPPADPDHCACIVGDVRFFL